MENKSLIKRIKDILVKIFPENTSVYAKAYLWGMRIDSVKRLKKRKKLKLDYHLSDHCNLNCNGCEHFSSIAPTNYPDFSSFESDFKRLAELFDDKIEYIHFIGGEPLLNPDVCKYLNTARYYFKSPITIRILTNGILLLKQTAEFWETCKKNNVSISITKYPIKLDFNKIQETASKFGVSLEFFGSSAYRIKTMRKKLLDLSGKQNVKQSFKLCYMPNECVQLYNGKIYTCATVPYIDFFNKKFGQNLKVSPDDYIDIYKARNSDEIFDFLIKPIPFCRNCDVKKTKHGIKWSAGKKEISEWT